MKNTGLTIFDKDFTIFSEGTTLLKESIKRILMTRPGERVNNLAFGSRIQEYIFGGSSLAIEDILTEIKSSIERNDNRISVSNVVLEKLEDETITISVYAMEKSTKQAISVGVIIWKIKLKKYLKCCLKKMK